MISIQKSDERGGGNFDWLETKHSFSFGDYYNPEMMGYRSLRVINEDYIAPQKGFGMHPHKDMEIITLVLSGALKHRDNMGNESVLRPGEFQRMTAGRGVLHSEFSDSVGEKTHLLQIWIMPESPRLEPSYEELKPERTTGLQLIASRDKASGSMLIHQDAKLYRGILEEGQELEYPVEKGRGLWLQLISGEITTASGETLEAGDGATVEGEALKLKAESNAEFLLFDLM